VVGVRAGSERESGYARFKSLYHAVTAIAERIDRQLLDRAQIGIADFEALDNVGRAEEGRLRLVDLARALVVSPSSATRITDRLESRQYVERQPSSLDRRETFIAITPDGSAKLNEARKFLLDAVETYSGPLCADRAPSLDEFLAMANPNGAERSHGKSAARSS
jgi:DNA-binding MarR family transcriptional regulator